jgi:hypothetical protein
VTTQYLIFASFTNAKNASEADWAVRVLGHPIPSTSATRQAWQIISNSAGTIGVIADNVPLGWLSSNEQGALVPETDPTVAAVLAQNQIAAGG